MRCVALARACDILSPLSCICSELWCGRGLFQKTLSIVKKTKNLDLHNKDWYLRICVLWL